MIIVIFGYRATMIIEILVVDRSSSTFGAGRKKRMRSSADSFHDLKKWQVISTQN